MVCNKCNAPVNEGEKFCPGCGNDLSVNPPVQGDVNTQPVEQAVVNNDASSVNVGNAVNVVPTQDKVNIWLVILSWFIPLAGLIIFFVQKKTSPKTAKASGICALISALLSIVGVVLSFSLLFGAMNFAVETTKDTAEEIIDQAGSQIEDIEDMLDENLETNITTDSSTTTDSTTTNVAVSNDWKQYQFGIGDKVYTLPMSYNDFKTASGFTIKDMYINMVLANNHYAPVNLYKNDKLALYIELFNNSGAELKYVDSSVTRISQTKYQVSQGADKIVFPGGLKVGDAITEAQLTALFGAPSEAKDYSGSKQYIYVSDTTWTTTNNFKINVIDGVIDEIQLDHRN